jgi:hypothetical protein
MLLAFVAAAPAAVASQAEPIGVYVTPFYNSEGPEVCVGKFSEKLAAADKESIREVTDAMEKEFASLPVVSMYVAAIRLYDLGQRDEAVHWFYAAQYRARLFQALLDESRVGGMGSAAFELVSAHNAFYQLVGPHMNGYAGCDQNRWLRVLEKVQAENKSTPDFATLYPSVAFIPRDQWDLKNAEVAAGLDKLAEYVESNWSEFEAKRAQNNIEAKFCRQ